MNHNLEPNTEEKSPKEAKETKPAPAAKREYILNDTVSNTTVKDIMLGILELNRQDTEKAKDQPDFVRQPIHLIVNTYGGSVYDGFALVAVIDSSDTPVHTYLYGKAMSMGLLIFAAGHRRFAHPLGTLMYHQISTGAQGKIEDIEQVLEQSKKLNDAYDNYLISVSNLTEETLKEVKAGKREFYLFATEGIEYGLVDEILVSKRKPA